MCRAPKRAPWLSKGTIWREKDASSCNISQRCRRTLERLYRRVVSRATCGSAVQAALSLSLSREETRGPGGRWPASSSRLITAAANPREGPLLAPPGPVGMAQTRLRWRWGGGADLLFRTGSTDKSRSLLLVLCLVSGEVMTRNRGGYSTQILLSAW